MAAPPRQALSVGDSPAMNPQRLARAMDRWRRRSRVIHFWRRALPALMAAIVLGVVGLVIYRSLTSGRAAPQDQAIRMLNPKFFGRDKSGRPFTVVAKDAVRDGLHPERVTLTQPHMVLQQINGDPPTKLDSAIGLYNENTHILALDGQVTLDDGKGNIFKSEHALVNTDEGTVDGRSPVTGTGPMGTTSANAYAVYDRGSRIVFMGDVKSHLVNK